MVNVEDVASQYGYNAQNLQQAIFWIGLLLAAVVVLLFVWFIIYFSMHRIRIVVIKKMGTGNTYWFDKGRIEMAGPDKIAKLHFFWTRRSIPAPSFEFHYPSQASYMAPLFGGASTIVLEQDELNQFYPVKAPNTEISSLDLQFKAIPQATEAIRQAEQRRLWDKYMKNSSWLEKYGALIVVILTVIACLGMTGMLFYFLHKDLSKLTDMLIEVSKNQLEVIKAMNIHG